MTTDPKGPSEAAIRAACYTECVDPSAEEMLRKYRSLIAAYAVDVAPLRTALEEARDAERSLSAAYIRLRRKLSAFGAFDTPFAPSGPTVWAVTEAALDRALASPHAREETEPNGG